MRREKDFIPYEHHVEPDIIQLKDRSVVTTFHVQGVNTAMMGAQAIRSLHERRCLTNRTLRSDGWTLHHNILRTPVTKLMETTPRNPRLHAIDMQAQKSLLEKGVFENRHYISIVRHTGLSLNNKAQFSMLRKKDRVSIQEGWIDELEQYAGQFEALMRPFGLRRLGCYRHSSGGWVSEQETLFGEIINGGLDTPMLLAGDLDQFLPIRRKVFKGTSWIATGRGPNTWGSMVVIDPKGYPSVTRPIILDDVLQSDFPLIVSQSFSVDDADESNLAFDAQIQRLDNAHGESAEDLIQEILADKKQITAGKARYGLHHFSITPLVTQEKDGSSGSRIASRRVTSYCNDIMSALSNVGIVSKRESFMNQRAMYFAQLPGALHDAGPRRTRVKTRNLSSFVAFNSEPTGQLTGNHWGDAVAAFTTLSRSLYGFNFHFADVGHFVALGKTGEGKTALIIFLLLMSQRAFKPPRVVVLDKDCSAEVAIRYAGGVYQDVQIGVNTGWNPYYTATTDKEIAEAVDFLFECMLITGCHDTSDNRDRVNNAVRSACELGEGHRNIDEIAGFLPDTGEGSTGHAIAPWKKGGRYYWVFGSKVDQLSLNNQFTGINLTELLDHKELGEVVTAYLLSRIQKMVNGEPIIVYLEEAWETLSRPSFLAKAVYFEKTMRKYEGIIGFGTQDGADLAKSPAAHQLISNLATIICAPHPDAGEKSYKGFQLSPVQVEAICDLPLKSRQYFVKTGPEAAVIDGDLSGLGEYLEILSSNPRKSAICAKLREQYGENPDDWATHYFKELRNEKSDSDFDSDIIDNRLQFAG